MLRNFVLAAVLCVLSVPVLGAGEKATAPKAAGTGTDICACNYTLIPLYFAWHPTHHDSFYTTNVDELLAAEHNGWLRLSDAGRVLNQSAPGTIPLYRLWSNAISKHIYTISMIERDRYTFASGWAYEGIGAYVLPGPACGTLPFYRTYNNVTAEHYYTNNPAEMANAMKYNGFAFESVAGYVWPVDPSEG